MTEESAAIDVASSTDEVGESPDGVVSGIWKPTSDTTLFWALLFLVALPFTIAALALIGETWAPSNDVALQLLKIGDVGTRRTPLLGAWSRWGWNHPGPWPTYLLAPFTWLFGPTGALVGTLMLNMASLMAAVVLGRRRGGMVLAGLVAVCGLAIGFAQGATFLMNPWNPYVGVLPVYALILVAWSLSDRDWKVMPLMVVFASFSIQAHVGFAPVVAVICVGGVMLAWRTGPADPGETPPEPDQAPAWRRPLIWSGVVAVVAWLPAMIEEIANQPGNLTLLARFSASSPEATVGWRIARDVLATELGVPGAWATGDAFPVFEAAPSPIGALVVVVAIATLGFGAWRIGSTSAARFAALTLIVIAGAVIATSRITGLPFDYLLTWWWAVGAAGWLSIAWSTWCLLRHRPFRRVADLMVGSTFALVVLLSLGLAGRAATASPPAPEESAAILSLREQIVPRLDEDQTYLISWLDERGWGGVGIGIFTDLVDDGFTVIVPDPGGVKFDEWRTGSRADVQLVVVSGDDATANPLLSEAGDEIASYDPLSLSERREYDELWSRIVDEAGSSIATSPNIAASPYHLRLLRGAVDDQSIIDRFVDLWMRGSAFTVYLTPDAPADF